MNGRLDHFVRGVLGVLALVSVSGTASASGGYFDTFDEAKSACVSDLNAAMEDVTHCADSGDGNLCGNENDCLESDPNPSWTEKLQDGSNWENRYGGNYTLGETHHFYYGECPTGMVEQDGQCVEEPECEHGEIQIGDNAGDCRSDCDAVANDGGNDYWGSGNHDDFTSVGPSCDPQTGCAVTPNRFHELVDGTVTAEWTHTGGACSAGSEPLGVGDAETDGCVGSGFTEFCYEEGTQEGNCGTFNGERVCFDAIPEDGACTGGSSAGDSYTCGAQGDYSIIPELGDGLTADEQGAVTMANATAEASVTVSGGSVVEGDTALDEPEPPTEGEDGAGDHDGTGDGEGEEEGFCDKAPHLCDDSKAEDLPDKDLPEDETDISDLVGPGDYPNVISAPAACPEPQTFALPDSMGGASIDMPYTAFCDFANYINPLIVSLSYLAAFFIGLRILI